MRLITTYILVACIALLVMTGCESESSTEAGSDWTTIDSLDFQVFIGNFSGYTNFDGNGNVINSDPRDWQVFDYEKSTSRRTRTVNLNEFTAQDFEDSVVILEWITESESDLSGYYILRNEIDDQCTAMRLNPFMIAATNTNEPANYSYSDHWVESSTYYYYWLEAVQYGGGSTYYGPLQILIDSSDDPYVPRDCTFVCFPNPFTGSSSFQYSIAQFRHARVIMYDQTLETFYKIKQGTINGSYSFTILAQELSLKPGLYRIFYNIYNIDREPIQWGYGDIMYDPDFEW